MTSKLSRFAAVATCAAGCCGLVAGPAAAANNYVTQPVVTGVSSLTPESAVLTGAIDTGGDPGVAFTASATSPFAVGGLSITSSATLNGIPLGQGFYSTALFEADPLSDYQAAGNQPGPETVTAATVEVPTTVGESAVSAEIGAYPASTSAETGSSPLTPGTEYVYWVISQAGETDLATTVNLYSASDLANWIAGSGPITSNGFGSASSASSSVNEASWASGTGSKYNGDPSDPTTIPGSIVNPDFSCQLNSVIAANTNSGWQAVLAANQDPTSAGSSTIGGVALPYGVASASSSGTFTATAAAQPAEQGSCVAFYGGNSTNFYTSPNGLFTTPPLGEVVIGGKAMVTGKTAKVTVTDKSVESAAGTIMLTTGKGKHAVTVAMGNFRAPAGGSVVAKLKLTAKGVAALSAGKLVTALTLTSTTDQPTTTKKVTLKMM